MLRHRTTTIATIATGDPDMCADSDTRVDEPLSVSHTAQGDDAGVAIVSSAAALACELPSDRLARRAIDTTQLFARARERRALADGAELEFPGDDATAQSLFDFVLFERACCAQLSYELAFIPDHSTVRLTLRGRGPQIEGIRAWAAVPAHASA